MLTSQTPSRSILHNQVGQVQVRVPGQRRFVVRSASAVWPPNYHTIVGLFWDCEKWSDRTHFVAVCSKKKTFVLRSQARAWQKNDLSSYSCSCLVGFECRPSLCSLGGEIMRRHGVAHGRQEGRSYPHEVGPQKANCL